MVFIGYCESKVLISSGPLRLAGSFDDRSFSLSSGVGNIIGPQCVFAREAPVYRSAAYAMLVSYAGKTVCHALLGLYVSSDPSLPSYHVSLADFVFSTIPLADAQLQQEARPTRTCRS